MHFALYRGESHNYTMHKFLPGFSAQRSDLPAIHYFQVHPPGQRPFVSELSDAVTRIGAGPEMDLRVDDPRLQREHLQIHYHDGYHVAMAIGRRSYFVIDNERHKRHRLRDGNRIRIGASELVYRIRPRLPVEQPVLANAMQPLLSAAKTLLEASALVPALDALLDAFVSLTRAEHAFLVLFARGRPQIHLARNDRRDRLGNSALQFSDSIVQTTLQSRQPLLIKDLGLSPFQTASSVVRLGLRSVLCLPLPEAEHMLGVLYAGTRSGPCPDLECIGPAQVLAALTMLRVRNALLSGELRLAPANLPVTIEPNADPDGAQGRPLVGRSLDKVRRTVARLAPMTVPVVVHGEPGTGKTLVAGELHRRSSRVGPVCWCNARALDTHTAFWSWVIQVARLPGTTLLLEDIEQLPQSLHVPLRELMLAHPSLRLVTTTTKPIEVLGAYLGPQLTPPACRRVDLPAAAHRAWQQRCVRAGRAFPGASARRKRAGVRLCAGCGRCADDLSLAGQCARAATKHLRSGWVQPGSDDRRGGAWPWQAANRGTAARSTTAVHRSTCAKGTGPNGRRPQRSGAKLGDRRAFGLSASESPTRRESSMNRSLKPNGTPSGGTTAAATKTEIADERASVGFFSLGGETYVNLLFNYGRRYAATAEDMCALLRSIGDTVLIARKLTADERAAMETEERNIAHEIYGRFIADVPRRWRFPAYYRVLGDPNARWPIAARQFITQLRKRWPTASIVSRKGASAVAFKLPRTGHVYDCEFDAAASSVTLFAPIDLTAELACWLRGLLPVGESLRLVDHAGTFDVAVGPHTTVAELIAARTGERLPAIRRKAKAAS